MRQHDNTLWLRLLGHAVLLALAVMSVVLAPERVLYTDSAAQFFELIQRRTFVIYDHRFTMAVTQLLPLLAIRFSLPLPVVLAAYSVSAPLLAWLVFCLVAYGLRQPRVAALLLLPLLGISHTFFHAISETFSLMVYATLLLALLQTAMRPSFVSRLFFSLIVALTVLAVVFIHPIGLFFVLFLVGFRLAENRFRITPELIVATLVLVAAVALRATMISGHDASYMVTAADVRYSLTHFFELTIVRKLVARCWLCLVALALYLLALLRHIGQRRWLPLAYGVAFNLAFIAMTAIVYRNDAGNIAVERAWLPLLFFAGVPLFAQGGREPDPSGLQGRPLAANAVTRVLQLLFVLLALLSLVRIAHISDTYRQRLDTMQGALDQWRRDGHRKVVCLSPDLLPLQPPSWATAFESLILSSLQSPDSTVTLYVEEPPVDLDATAGDYQTLDAFLAVPWNRLWNYSTLHPRYFRLPLQPSLVLD